MLRAVFLCLCLNDAVLKINLVKFYVVFHYYTYSKRLVNVDR